MKLARIWLCVVAPLLVAAPAALAAGADNYPSRPIQIVVPFAPGASTDISARTVGQKLGEAWKQQVIVDNKPGASGLIGAGYVAKAAPDGYTLVMGAIGTHATNASLFKNMPYDTLNDFAPIVHVMDVTLVLVVHPSLPVKSVKELIAFAKSHPGTLNYASGGIAASQHLAGELFKAMTGVDMLHAPYKGSANALSDLLGGRMHLMFADMPLVLQHIQVGKLRPLAVADEKRTPLLPDVPTVAQAGVPGYKAFAWYGLFAPARTPRDIVLKLNQESNRILALPDVKERFAGLGALAVGGTPEEFRQFQESEMKRWDKIIKTANIKIDQ
jgi:tripartite-type tricarboxylate transporter receptor subunit TctC